MAGFNISVDDAQWSQSWRCHYSKAPRPLPAKPFRGYGSCFYCGVPLQTRNQKAPDFKTRDHIVPKCSGGRGPQNYVDACRWCNTIKGHKSVEEFRAILAGLKCVDVATMRFYGEIRHGIPIHWLYALNTDLRDSSVKP